MGHGRRGWWAQHGLGVVYDVAPPVILLGLGLLDVFTGAFAIPVGEAPPITALVPGALSCAALLFRRRYPLVVLVVVLVLVFVPPLVLPMALTYWDEFAVWLVAMYSCSRHLRLRSALVALGVGAIGMVVLPLEFAELRDAGDIVYNSFLVGAAFALGLLTRTLAAYRLRALEDAARRAVAEERASARERGRIARELHDVISHTITVIVMQAGGARLAATQNPGVAVDALARIERLGKDSLGELRTLLTVLGEGEPDKAAPAPQPALADLPSLCERMRELGLTVRLHADDVDGASMGVQLAAYRVVQEALTNVLKHAGPVDVDVVVGLDGHGELRVEVSSAPGWAAASVPGSNRGLAGMRERVDALGGTLAAVPRTDGGFVVTAGLPEPPA
ncbi:histidine kinase [Microbacterium horticulturae]|uniref:histidine kinase n=1 Tax=Microbacterium horticulturae TaxID=3028316 RepID=A0ABY8C588_9MICO|nr:histidine kinase [Microbacterium sp. KACC 23027]WEG10365.1 histidine kinase [Microbacterium sp. KACC 23027]